MVRAGFIVVLLALAVLTVRAADAPAAQAALIEVDGAIGPATVQYYAKASDTANAMGARLIILRLDTPGGLDTAMREIIQHILASDIPVVSYVAPAGARAASAGTYIVYATHIAAMAPATNLGAATPVPALGGAPKPPGAPKPEGEAPAEPAPDPEQALERKAVNDAVAYLRSLAEQRGRNADWAERAVREGASLSALEAQRQNVIELIAEDSADLLRQLHGRRIKLARGSVVLDTTGMTIVAIEPDWRQRILAVLTNPAVAYILLLLGIYGLLLEGYNPGAILPGVVGAICLLLALYAFQILPVNYAGLALIVLGICLIIAETLVPSLGVLGIGGVIAFVAGSIMLLDTDVPGYEVPIAIVAAIATGAGSLVLLTVTLLLRSRRHRVVTGHEGMLGLPAEALEDFESEGWVRAAGERWRARSAVPVRRGDILRVMAVKGLVLEIGPPPGDRP